MSLPSSLGESVGVQLCCQRWPVCWTPQGASARDHEFEHWGPPSRWFGPSNSWRWTRAVLVCPLSWKETIIRTTFYGNFEFQHERNNALPQVLVDVLYYLKGDVRKDPKQVGVIKEILKEHIDMRLDFLLERLWICRDHKPWYVWEGDEDHRCWDWGPLCLVP